MPALHPAQTVSEALHTATIMLSRVSPSARLDAELLLEHVTGHSRATFRAHPDRELPPQAGWSYQQLLKRRLQGEPVAYIRGEQGFWSLVLEVSPAVLIPRPETELVVERALEHLDSGARDVADLGTGSGAIALAIAHDRPNARVIAVDASKDALEIARRNANRLQIPNVSFVHGSWFGPLSGQTFDVIASNPPYIAPDDADVSPEVRRYEPETALFAGKSGLAALEHICTVARAYLKPDGWVVLEHGWKQAHVIRDLLVRNGFTHVRSHRDLAGHERVTEGKRD